MPEIVVLAKNLKEIRRELKQNQFDFAYNCGISIEILSLLERGQSDPKLSTLQKIAAYIGCTVSELIDVEGCFCLPENTRTRHMTEELIS